MKEYLAAERYARALNAALPDDAQLEPALDWIQTFADLLTNHSELRTLLRNPAVPKAARSSVLEEVLDKLDADTLLRNLIRELFRRGRLGIASEVADTFGRMVDARLNRVTARVVTAEPITSGQSEKIRAGLVAYAHKDISLKKRVDPAVIGGVVVKIDGVVIDGSLRSRLKQLRNALLSEENGTV